MKNGWFRAVLPGTAVFLLIFSACDSAPPELQQVYWQLNVQNDLDRNEIYEALSIWVQAVDEDGRDDIEYIYIIHDEGELMWVLTPDNWNINDRQGEQWVGTNLLISADLSPFPRGEYRIVLVDTAGERDERTFFMSTAPTDTSADTLPEALVTGEELSVKNAENGFSIWGYSGEETFIGSMKNLNASVPFSRIEESIPGFDYLYIYSYEVKEGYGFVTGPYTIRYEDRPSEE